MKRRLAPIIATGVNKSNMLVTPADVGGPGAAKQKNPDGWGVGVIVGSTSAGLTGVAVASGATVGSGVGVSVGVGGLGVRVGLGVCVAVGTDVGVAVGGGGVNVAVGTCVGV